MKKLLCLMGIVAVLLTSQPASASGDTYAVINGAYGGEFGIGSGGVEFGVIQNKPEHRWLGGMGFSVIPVGGRQPDYKSYSIEDDEGPGASFTVVGPYPNNELELSGKIGFEILRRIFLIGGLGCSWGGDIRLAQSGTNTLYKYSSESSEHSNQMGELRYISESWSVGVGYDHRRGVVISGGFKF